MGAAESAPASKDAPSAPSTAAVGGRSRNRSHSKARGRGRSHSKTRGRGRSHSKTRGRGRSHSSH